MNATENNTVKVEGATLEEALEKAAGELGIPRSAVEFEYDREHLASGAHTVRVFARKGSGEAPARREPAGDAPASPRGEGDRRGGFERRDRGDRGDRRGGGGGRDRGDRRGGGGGDRDRRGGGRDRGPRGPRGEGDRRPGGGGGDRDRGPRERQPIDRDAPHIRERDEKLRAKAREMVEKVLAGEGPQAIEDLNSYERHLVHTIVAEAGLASESKGEALRKTVHITKKDPQQPQS